MCSRYVFAVAALLLLVVAIIYWPGMNGPLVLDDIPNLLPLRLLDAQQRLSFDTVMAERLSGIDGRPLAMLSFIANWRLTGDSIWWLKATNIAIHLLCSALVFLFACLVLRMADASRVSWAALWVCAAWALAPIHVSSVLYVIQRMAQLGTLFCLIAMCCYLIARVQHAERPVFAHILFACVFALWWPLAVLSKQTGVALPYLIGVIELWALSHARACPLPHVWRNVTIICCLLPVAALIARFVVSPQWLQDGYELREFALIERLLSEPRVLWNYVASVLQLPGGQALGLFRDDVAISTTLLKPWSTLPSVLAWVGVVVIAVHFRRSRFHLVVGGIMLFLVAHGLEASFVPIELAFEHRNYLPAVGLFLSLGAAIELLPSRLRQAKSMWLVLALIPLLYAGMSALRVETWRSFEGIVAENVRAHPNSVRAQASAAVLAAQSGELSVAHAHLDRVVMLGGTDREFAVLLKRIVAYCYAHVSVPLKVYQALEAAPPIDDDPYTVGALGWLRETVTEGRCTDALDVSRLAMALHTTLAKSRLTMRHNQSWYLHNDVGQLLLGAGHGSLARAQLTVAHALAPMSRRATIERHLQAVSR